MKPRNPAAFRGLHGVFADSLPDAWGELLVEVRLKTAQRARSGITVLDRLSDVGADGRGAIVYVPTVDHDNASRGLDLDLDALAVGAQDVIAGTAGDIVRELEMLGRSSGGARPKVQVWMGRRRTCSLG